jgi:hypothetical protein
VVDENALPSMTLIVVLIKLILELAVSVTPVAQSLINPPVKFTVAPPFIAMPLVNLVRFTLVKFLAKVPLKINAVPLLKVEFVTVTAPFKLIEPYWPLLTVALLASKVTLLALSVPFTVKPCAALKLTTTPLSIVSVMPALTVTVLVTT